MKMMEWISELCGDHKCSVMCSCHEITHFKQTIQSCIAFVRL